MSYSFMQGISRMERQFPKSIRGHADRNDLSFDSVVAHVKATLFYVYDHVCKVPCLVTCSCKGREDGERLKDTTEDPSL